MCTVSRHQLPLPFNAKCSDMKLTYRTSRCWLGFTAVQRSASLMGLLAASPGRARSFTAGNTLTRDKNLIQRPIRRLELSHILWMKSCPWLYRQLGRMRKVSMWEMYLLYINIYFTQTIGSGISSNWMDVCCCGAEGVKDTGNLSSLSN